MSKEFENLIDIEVIKKEHMSKAVAIIITSIIVIITAAILGIVVAKVHNGEILSQYSSNADNEENGQEVKEEVKTSQKLPVYSEDAKNRMNNIYLADGEEKIAYLTFDDGPSSAITPQILQILKDNDIKASFFVLGSRVELLPDLVKQEYEEGHYIANHGYSHDYTKVYASANAVFEEYNVTENAIRKAIGNEEYASHILDSREEAKRGNMLQ